MVVPFVTVNISHYKKHRYQEQIILKKQLKKWLFFLHFPEIHLKLTLNYYDINFVRTEDIKRNWNFICNVKYQQGTQNL